MKTLFDPQEYSGMKRRIDLLTPQSERQWGQMTLNEMLCHTADQLRVALGEIRVESRHNFFTRSVIKWLVIYLLPVPRGKVPTVPEMQVTEPDTFEGDREALRDCMQRFVEKQVSDVRGEHPIFGRLSGKEWGRLAWKHLDHHLKQFDV